MNLTPEVCENALARLQSVSKAQLHTVQHYFARRDLEAHLAALLEAARGHETQNLPPGSAHYVVLHQQSERLVAGYCERWQITPDQLHAELPALGRLRQLAQPQLRKAPMINIALAVLACLAAGFVLGIAAAFVRLGYHLVGGPR